MPNYFLCKAAGIQHTHFCELLIWGRYAYWVARGFLLTLLFGEKIEIY